jgi:hypothetical protein
VGARARLQVLVVMVIRRLGEAPPHGDILSRVLGVPADLFNNVCISGITRYAAEHAAAGHAFLLYVGLGGGGGCDEESWRGWKTHHADARRHAEAALRRLRAAAARAHAFEDAVRAAWTFPRWSPGWVGWMSAALRLELLARVSARMAHCDLRRMRRAIAREFHDTWKIVNRR